MCVINDLIFSYWRFISLLNQWNYLCLYWVRNQHWISWFLLEQEQYISFKRLKLEWIVLYTLISFFCSKVHAKDFYIFIYFHFRLTSSCLAVLRCFFSSSFYIFIMANILGSGKQPIAMNFLFHYHLLLYLENYRG